MSLSVNTGREKSGQKQVVTSSGPPQKKKKNHGKKYCNKPTSFFNVFSLFISGVLYMNCLSLQTVPDESALIYSHTS